MSKLFSEEELRGLPKSFHNRIFIIKRLFKQNPDAVRGYVFQVKNRDEEEGRHQCDDNYKLFRKILEKMVSK